MKRLSITLLAIVVLLCSNQEAIASRLPSLKSAQSIATSFFKSYSKKYKDSALGQNKPTKVTINGIAELQRHLAMVDAVVQLESGQMMRVLINLKKNPPFGWNVSSWETIEVR